jgi:hypothetical protein
MMVWLAPGIEQGDTYKCKGCQLSFVVRAISEETSQPPEEPPVNALSEH